MPEDFWTVFTWAAIIAVVAAVASVIAVVVKYKKKLKAPIYPIDRYANLALFARRDDFIGSNITRVRVSSSKNKR